MILGGVMVFSSRDLITRLLNRTATYYASTVPAFSSHNSLMRYRKIFVLTAAYMLIG
jgi:hypothetical protein